MLDNCDPTFSSGRGGNYAFLKIGRMHGVTVAIEDRHDPRGEVPALVRQGVVLRFLIPRGANLADLASGLGDCGHLDELIDAVLAGHLLTLLPDSAVGRLTEAAALARDHLLEAIGSLGPMWQPTEDSIEIMMRRAAELRLPWSAPEPACVC